MALWVSPKRPIEGWLRRIARLRITKPVTFKGGSEGVGTIPYRYPAAVGGDEVRGLAVALIQGVAIGTVPAPGGAVSIHVKVEVAHQFIANAAGVGTAEGDAWPVDAVFIAGSREVVAHVVEHGQVVDIDQAIAVMVGKVTPLKVLEVVDLQGGGKGFATVGGGLGHAGLHGYRLCCGTGGDHTCVRVNGGCGAALGDAPGDRPPLRPRWR